MNKNLIWIADDDPIFRMIFKMTIKKVNQSVSIVEFMNGKLVCESFKKFIINPESIPCCVFMDVNMPIMNGWGCLDKMNEMYVEENSAMPKVFIMSSSINKDDEERIANYPFVTGYLRKPISIETFEEIFAAGF